MRLAHALRSRQQQPALALEYRKLVRVRLDRQQRPLQDVARNRVSLRPVDVEGGIPVIVRNLRAREQLFALRRVDAVAAFGRRDAVFNRHQPASAAANFAIRRRHLTRAPYSTTINRSPAATVAPSATKIFVTTPSLEDFISFCIFIASTTIRLCPLSTFVPGSTSSFTTFPGMSARNSSGPASDCLLRPAGRSRRSETSIA